MPVGRKLLTIWYQYQLVLGSKHIIQNLFQNMHFINSCLPSFLIAHLFPQLLQCRYTLTPILATPNLRMASNVNQCVASEETVQLSCVCTSLYFSLLTSFTSTDFSFFNQGISLIIKAKFPKCYWVESCLFLSHLKQCPKAGHPSAS